MASLHQVLLFVSLMVGLGGFNTRATKYSLASPQARLTLTGLSHLERYGTVRVYCKNAKPRVDVSLVSRAPLKISIPWKYCGGKSGVVATHANHVKVCINFEVDEVENNVTLRPVRVSPKWIETLDVKVDGAGDTVKTVASILGKIMSAK
ncbi:hypothetical protein MRX96_001945 [Rhipicephalus microplus]